MEKGKIFDDLASIGIDYLDDVDLFDDDSKGKEDTAAAAASETAEKVFHEEDFLFDKSMTCPVCDKAFKTKKVRTGKAHFLGSDSDLRPIYEGVDSIKYDAVVCLHCGYAAMERNFSNITPKQIRDVKSEISAKFKGMVNTTDAYSYEVALQRYKLVLFNDLVKHAKLSDRAYVCLKIAWLYRGEASTLDEKMADYQAKYDDCKLNEAAFIKKAYEGFSKALMKEYPPICGMDEATLDFMMADLARQCKDYDSAEKFAFAVISSRVASAKIKNRTRDKLTQIREEKAEA